MTDRELLIAAGPAGLTPAEMWPDVNIRTREWKAARMKRDGEMFWARSKGIRYFATQEWADAAKAAMVKAAKDRRLARPRPVKATNEARLVELLKAAGGRGMSTVEVADAMGRTLQYAGVLLAQTRNNGGLFSRPDLAGNTRNALRYYAIGVTPEERQAPPRKASKPDKPAGFKRLRPLAPATFSGEPIIPKGLKPVVIPHGTDHRHTVQPHEVTPYFSALPPGVYP
jgi:hypothetical protein